MLITSLSISNLRNHERSDIELRAGVNVFSGRNGQGKTSILEAVALCALSKSFVACPDAALLRRGSEALLANLEARSDLGTPYKVALRFKPGERKHISSTLAKRLTPQELIGELPLVVLSPDFRGITAGPPQQRRQMMDSVLAQASRRFRKEGVALKRILRQRNALLQRGRSEPGFDYSQVDPWTEQLIATGAEIVHRRARFLHVFAGHVRQAYSSIAGANEVVALRYEPNALPGALLENDALPAVSDIAEGYRDVFTRLQQGERLRGMTLAGPQKDDVEILVNDGLARECASQGQHKSLLISIKLAEFSYLRELRGETPVVLLDDIFSELDEARSARVLELMRSDAQTLITTTDLSVFHQHFAGDERHALYTVRAGRVTRQ